MFWKSLKNTKIGKQRVLVNFHIYNNFRLKKSRKQLQRAFPCKQIHQLMGNISVFKYILPSSSENVNVEIKKLD